MLLVSYTQEPGVTQGASSLIPERNKHKMRFERKGAAPPCKPSLTPKPMRVNQVHRACDQYTEWACWMAGGNVIKVTVGPRGTSWLRCSASKLNTDRKPRVWYCKKIICLPARVRLANQRVCFHLKEILTTMREEGMKLCGYQKSSPPLPWLLQSESVLTECLYAARQSAVDTPWVTAYIWWSASLFNPIRWPLSQSGFQSPGF